MTNSPMLASFILLCLAAGLYAYRNHRRSVHLKKALSEFRFDNTHELRAILIPEPEGGFSILSTNFPSAMSQGETKEEAIKNLKESFYGVVECMKEDGKPIVWEQVEIDDDIIQPGSVEVRVLVSV